MLARNLGNFESNLCQALLKVMLVSMSHSSNRTLIHLLERWRLQCTVVPMETSDPGEGVVIEGLMISDTRLSTEHTIHLWEIVKTPCIQAP